MDDKLIMDTMLTSVKNACDLMLHGSIESSNAPVHNCFKNTLDDCLAMQNSIYNKMSEKGWYPAQTAEQAKIDAARQKFSAC